MQIYSINIYKSISFKAKKQKRITQNDLTPYSAYQKAMLQRQDRSEVQTTLGLIKYHFRNASKSEIKTNPKFIEYINKPPIIPNYKTLDEVFSKTKSGEIFEFEDKLYIKEENEINELKLSKETFEKLFPPLETFALVQGDIDNCFFVCAVFDFLKNPKTRGTLFSMFEEKEDEIIVTIPDSKNNPISFPKNYKNKTTEHIFGSLGIQMLENAYLQTRANKYGIENKTALFKSGNQRQVYSAFLNTKKGITYLDENEDYIIRPQDEIYQEIEEMNEYLVFLHSVLKDESLFNEENFKSINQVKYYIDDSISILRNLYDDYDFADSTFQVNIDKILNILIQHANNDDYLISLSSKQEGSLECKEKGIVTSHAYSLLNLDKKNKTINLINPWNTSAFITIAYDEFKKYFSAIEIVKLQ